MQPIHPAGIEVLEQVAEVRVAQDPSVAGLLSQIADVEGILVRTAPLPGEVIEAALRLRVIARHGVGVDNIDVAAATRRGIPVAYTPNANATSVAEHALVLMGALAKQLLPYDRATRAGQWEVRNSYRAIDLGGRTLGVVGLGRIGREVARRARAAFDMRVMGYDPYLDEATVRALGIQPVATLEELLEAADVVSVHVPLTEGTRHLIGAAELARMKPTALLINTSRGPVVDQAALVKALREGRIAGAGLDVFDPEPPPDSLELFTLDNVVVTPHSAALTTEAVIRMATGAAQAIVDVLSGRRPEHVVNPEVFEKA
ncbi:MAG TPA: hydroxyacid dehydrogenase [Limnochordales bacterium]